MSDVVVNPGVTPNSGVTSPTVDPASGNTGNTPWYQGKVDDTTVGYWKNKGWSVDDPHSLATSITKSYQEAERYVGAPPSELLRMPKPGDEPGQRQFWERLGAPVDPTGYDFSTLKFSNGDALEPEFQEYFRAQAHALHLPKDAAVGVTQAMMKFMEQQEAAETARTEGVLKEENLRLRADWGPNFDANLRLAKEGAQKFGIDPSVVETLQNSVGMAKTMELFRRLGAGMSEDMLVSPRAGNGGGPQTAGEAQARLAELKADKGFVKRYMDGDILARQEMDRLHAVIAEQQQALMR